MTNDELDWGSTGFTQHVPAARLEATEEKFGAAYSYAVASRTHLWVVTLAHQATDVLLDSLEGKADGPPMLDTDTLLTKPAVGCYVCEQSYAPRLRLRRCPGEPGPGGRRG